MKLRALIVAALMCFTTTSVFADYVLPDPAGRDGWVIDTATGNIHVMRAGSSVMNVDTNGLLTITDITISDDLTVTDDLAVTGLVTIGETLAVTGNVAVNTNKFTVTAASGNTLVAGTLTSTGDATLNGGAGALTMTAANSSIVCLDNSATGLVAGSSGNPNMLQFDTQTGAEKIIVEGTTTAVALHVDVGTALVDESLEVTGVSTLSDDVTFGGGAGAITATAAGSSLVCLDNSATGFVMGSSGNPNMLQFDTQTGVEKIIVEGTTTQVALHVDVGTALVDESLEVTGVSTLSDDVTFGGGAGALTATAAGSSLVCLDNSATGFVMGSSGNPNMLQFDTQTGVEKIIVEGTTSQVALHVDVGTMLVDESIEVTGASTLTADVTASAGLTAVSPALLYKEIRFCGNGPNAGTETFLSPVPYDDTEADFIDGGAGCDGEDDVTIANADEPWPDLKDAAFKPVAMVCTAVCTGATAANDVVVFRLMDDTAAVTGMTCSTSALGGDGVPSQCTVTDTTPETVAAGSAIAIGVDNTDDACEAASDDFSCIVFVTF